MKRIIINKNLVTSEIQRYVGPIDLSEESFAELLKISTIEKVKKFLLDNKDILILSGQLALVALVCVVGIKNDLTPEQCCKKKRKKKR